MTFIVFAVYSLHTNFRETKVNLFEPLMLIPLLLGGLSVFLLASSLISLFLRELGLVIK